MAKNNKEPVSIICSEEREVGKTFSFTVKPNINITGWYCEILVNGEKQVRTSTGNVQLNPRKGEFELSVRLYDSKDYYHGRCARKFVCKYDDKNDESSSHSDNDDESHSRSQTESHSHSNKDCSDECDRKSKHSRSSSSSDSSDESDHKGHKNRKEHKKSSSSSCSDDSDHKKDHKQHKKSSKSSSSSSESCSDESDHKKDHHKKDDKKD